MVPDWSRRSLLASVGSLALAGCGGRSDTPATTPLSGTFDAAPETAVWHRSLDGRPMLAASDDLYVLVETAEEAGTQSRFQSRLVRIAPDRATRWDVNIDAATGNPLAVGDTVYHFRSESPYENSLTQLAAHDAETGEKRWTQSVEPHSGYVGTTGDAVFVGATSDDPTRLPVTVYETASGAQRWQVVTSMPMTGVVSHGLCLVGTYPDTVVALTTDSGANRWQHTVGPEQSSYIDGMHVVGDTLYVNSEAGAKTYGLPDGRPRWNQASFHTLFAASNGADDADQPPTLYVGGEDTSLHALHLATGEEQWYKDFTAGGPSVVWGATHGDGTVVAASGNTLYGLDAGTGTERWRQVVGSVHRLATPLLIDGTVVLLHAPTADELLVKTFDLDSGERRWRYQLSLVDNLIPRPVTLAGRVIIATEKGDFYGISPG